MPQPEAGALRFLMKGFSANFTFAFCCNVVKVIALAAHVLSRPFDLNSEPSVIHAQMSDVADFLPLPMRQSENSF